MAKKPAVIQKREPSITIRFEPGIYEVLERLAHDDDRRLTDYCRRIITQHLKTMEPYQASTRPKAVAS